MSWRKDIDRILLPEKVWEEIITHCRRKVAGDFLPGESKVNRAFGILAGVHTGRELHVRKVLPVKKNARNQEPLKSFMDKMMEEHAVPSTTPLNKRGWITDPQEFRECLELCTQEGLSIFGAYHIHVVPWEGDPLRDTPTRLDTLLVKESKMFSFIISMVDIDKPSMRAFFEGKIDQESPIIIV
ncbi:MAG: hypothetical protein WGN25_20085 [Candidatus Electrothrix sp. GW3-4]|uniref:hypothetical protein n=1 Tax=Candidatus Electrothrix sp. GW3-4 TaxID=3126740 RepID=UPI0030D06F70